MSFGSQVIRMPNPLDLKRGNLTEDISERLLIHVCEQSAIFTALSLPLLERQVADPRVALLLMQVVA